MASWSASRKVTMVFPKRHGKSCPTRVVFSRRDAENAEDTYAYDGIGNLLESSSLSATNLYSANNLNQYTSISNLCVSAPLRELSYDPNGNLLTNGVFSYTYDAANRLASVSSNGAAIATFAYDAQGRRVRKTISHGGPETQRVDYIWDGWLLVSETISTNGYPLTTIHYHWGKDLSGSPSGAGGIGGLLYVSVCNSSTPNSSTQQLFFPTYDNNGNITRYLDAQGNVVASYTYDAFGNTVSQCGPMVDDFAFRFSTKYYDSETGLYYYGYRYYSPCLMRWFNRDPIEEQGGLNLYAFCGNNGVDKTDKLGLVSFCDCVSVAEIEVRYKKAWWKYAGHIKSEPRYTETLVGNSIKKKKDNCDTAYMLELTVEPKGGRDMLVNQNHPENAEGKPCKLLTGNEFKQNIGPPRKEQRYWPVITFEVDGEKKIMRLWEVYVTFKGEYGINSIATRYLELLPAGSKIKITAQIDSRELDEPEAITSFGIQGVKEITLK